MRYRHIIKQDNAFDRMMRQEEGRKRRQEAKARKAMRRKAKGDTKVVGWPPF
jgi:hypothetical protein